MSLSITINNINDLTDTERAVLRYVLDGVPISDKLHERKIPPADGGVSDTKKYLELIGHTPVPPAAPAASIPTPPIPASAELDSDGLPWDKRIHSSSRAKVADGTWRKLRGVDDALVATVEAELRAVQAIPVPAQEVTYVGDGTGIHGLGAAVVPGLNADPNQIPPAGCYPDPVPAPPAPVEHSVLAGSHVPVPPAPTATLAEMQAKLDAVEPPAPVFNIEQAPLIVPVPVPAAPLTFADLMKHVTPMLVGNKLSQDKLLAICAEVGLPHLAALGARPDLVEAVKARIDAEVGND